MRKEHTKELIILLGFLIIGTALYLGISKIEVRPKIIIEPEFKTLGEELIQEKYNDYEMWGYYNGLVMPKRILSENEFFKEKGWSYNRDMTCESVVEELYQLGLKHYIRPD